MANLTSTRIFGDLTVKRDIKANSITSERFNSTTATGTSPFTVASTTKVKNLNADLVDDKYVATTATANTIVSRDEVGGINATTVTATGNISGGKVYGAVWNDIADFLEVPDDTIIEFGKVYTRSKDKVEQTTKVNQKAIGIASDTFGLSIGKKGKGKEIPIALGGWVLAYVDKVYDFGTELVATKNGGLTKASLITSMFRSNRVVAIFDRKEEMKEWNGVEVKGRHWVKVK